MIKRISHGLCEGGPPIDNPPNLPKILLPQLSFQLYKLANDSITCSWTIYSTQLIEDAKIILNSWQVGHVKRNVNRVLKKLEKEAVHQSMAKIWMDCFPGFIRDHIFVEAVDVV